jgi:hypothetical protein
MRGNSYGVPKDYPPRSIDMQLLRSCCANVKTLERARSGPLTNSPSNVHDFATLVLLIR